MEDQDQSTQQQPCLCLSASHPKHLYLALDDLANGGPERQQRHAQEHAKDHAQEMIHEPSLCLFVSQSKHLYLALDELANGGPERQQRHAQEHAQGTIHEPSSDQQWMDYHDAWKENFCA
jgi:hypothetical protein